jgi:hypothetical protein
MSIGVLGENLTFGVRKDLIRGILYKQLVWFDREKRAPGVLTSVMSEDVFLLNGMTTETVIILVETCMNLVTGVLLGLYYCW